MELWNPMKTSSNILQNRRKTLEHHVRHWMCCLHMGTSWNIAKLFQYDHWAGIGMSARTMQIGWAIREEPKMTKQWISMVCNRGPIPKYVIRGSWPNVNPGLRNPGWWRIRGTLQNSDAICYQNDDRRKFRSQTSDNMDRWKAEQGRGREKRKIRRKKSRRERVRRKKMEMREKVGKSRNTMFFQWFGAPEGRKVGSLKRQVRSQLARWEMKSCTPLWREAHVEVKMYKTPQLRTTFGSCDVEKVHAVGARSTFWIQNVQNTPLSDHFWKLRCRKSARRCGAKHILKSKCTKHTILGPLLEVEMSKKCTPLWREAHFEVKMYKIHQVRPTFGSWDVEKVHAVVARSTFPSQNVQNTTCSRHFWRFGCWKSARRCGAKHISKSKCTKHHMFAPLLEVRMLKKCTPLWREAHFQVKMYKTPHVRATFRGSDVEKVHAVVARSTFRSENVQSTRGSDHFWRFRCRFAASLHYTTLRYITPHSTILHYTTLHNTTTTTTQLDYTPLHSTTLNFTTLHYTTLRSTTLHYIKLHSTTLHYTTLRSTTLQRQLHNYTPLHSTTLNYTTLHYPTLHYITLHYNTLNDTAPQIDR